MPGPAPEGNGSQGRDSIAATLTLAAALLLGAACFLIPFSMLVVPEVPIGSIQLDGVTFEHNQSAETLVFALVFLVLLPLAAWRIPLLTRRLTGRPGGDRALAALAAGLAFTLGLLVAFVRVSGALPWGDGIAVAALVFGAWCVVAGAVLVLAGRDEFMAKLAAIGSRTTYIQAATAAGVAMALLSLVEWRNVDLPVLALGLAVVAAGVYAVARLRVPGISRGLGRTVDVAVFLLVVLAVPDMVIFPTDEKLITYVIQFHQNLFLGPASQVLDGQVLLVDTVSQYGIGSIYLISAFFGVVPIGHGTLGFLDGFLSALVIACGYLIMRLAGVRRLIAAPAIAVAVVVMAWGLTYPVGGLLQHGAIRYGLPVLLIAAATAGSRWPGTRRPMLVLSLALVGLSSVWALEAFTYTFATWVGLLAFGFVMAANGSRSHWLVVKVMQTVVALIVVHLLFALATLVASGELPDWNLYLTYLRDFVSGDIGDLTYDYMPWSRGLGVGAFYLMAVLAMVLTVWHRRELVESNRTAFVAAAGSLAYGIALYSYFVNRSLDHVLPYLLLPLFLLVAIGLSLMSRPDSGVTRRAFLATLAGAMTVAVFAMSAVAPGIPDRASSSLLGYVIPGGPSLADGFDRLWNPPPLVAGADEAERLLEEEMPGEDRSAVITSGDLSVEALARAGRANSLGFSDPKENSWVPGPNLPIITGAIDDLEPGTLLLVDRAALGLLEQIQADPGLDATAAADAAGLEPLQGYALELIDERFRLEPVVTGSDGLEVVRLEPKQAESTGSSYVEQVD